MRFRLLLPAFWAAFAWAGEPATPPPATTPMARGIVVMSHEPYLEVTYGVDLPRLRRLRGLPEKGRGAWAIQQIAAGRLAASVQVKALVDTSAARRRGILESLLRQQWPGPRFDPEQPLIRDFLDYSGRLLNMGDVFEYRCAARQVWVRYQQEEWRAFKSADLCMAVIRFNFVAVPANSEAMQAFETALDEALK